MENKKIYKAIAEIMGEIGAIGKDRKNQQQGFMYRGVEDVMNTLQPLFKKYGVFIVPEVMEHNREERQTKSGGNLIYSIMKIRHHFTAEDGSEVVSTTIGEGMDSADKASNKAMSIAFKYACFQVFCIPTEEMQDPDADTPPNSNVKDTPPNSNVKPIKQPENKPENAEKSNETQKSFEPLTKTEMVQVWGERSVEEMIAYFEKQFGETMSNWDEYLTDLARSKLAERKKKREEAERLKAGLQSISDDDIPFPMYDE